MDDLNSFQRDILRTLAITGEVNGLRVKDFMEEEGWYGAINVGRLYTNMDTLVNRGLVHKQDDDGRSNAYKLTRRGQSEVQDFAETWSRAAEAIG